jgi:hypothetical protein
MVSKRFIHVDQFNSDAVQFAGASATGDAAENTNTNIDYTCPYDLCITGAVMLVKGGVFGDKCSLQVVHPTYGVLNEFATDWAIAEDTQKQFELALEYPANLPTGLKIRLVYKANATAGTRKVAMNYLLHKVLAQEV